MEKEPGSWFAYKQFEPPPSYSNLSNLLRGNCSVFRNPYMKEVCATGTFPLAPNSGVPAVPLSEARQPIEPFNWFYGIPRFRQTIVPPLASMLKVKPASDQMDNYGVNGSTNAVSNSIKKQFLVFDQSGDQTSLIYSSGIRIPVDCSTSWNPKPYTRCDVIKEDVLLKENANPEVLSFQNLEGNQVYPEDRMEDEMHEDTEELNALLYSDDENDYSEDDEITSTDHSPSTMTDHGIPHFAVEEDEEVASSACSMKRQKLIDGTYNVPPLVHTFSLEKKPFKSCELVDDAESYCGNFDNQVSGDTLSVSGKKRSRTEKIRKTLSILQNIIPGAKGKDATVVIDEAVHYLKFLKDNAKSLGLDTP